VYADARNAIIIFLGVPSKCGVVADDLKYFLCDLKAVGNFTPVYSLLVGVLLQIHGWILPHSPCNKSNHPSQISLIS
jgi:hypothetical protein